MREEPGGAPLGDPGEVRPGRAELALQVVAFAGELVPLAKQLLVLGLEPVAFVGEPGAVGLAELPEQPGGEAALRGQFVLQIPGPLFGVERPFPPGGLLLCCPGGMRPAIPAWVLACAAVTTARAWPFS